jgi:hypothetical protein
MSNLAGVMNWLFDSVFVGSSTPAANNPPKAKIALCAIIFGLGSIAFYTLFYALIGFHLAMLVNSLLFFLIGLCAGIFLKTGSFRWIGNSVAMVVWVSMSMQISISGGLHSPMVPWLLVAPVSAYLVDYRLAGIFWSGIIILTTLFFSGFERLGLVYLNLCPAEKDNIFTVIVLAGFFLFVIILVGLFELERQKNITYQARITQNLQIALAEVKELSGMLPICASCKKIRDDTGYWAQLETYIMEHSKAAFTHSICPDCFRRLYPELNLSMEQDQKSS